MNTSMYAWRPASMPPDSPGRTHRDQDASWQLEVCRTFLVTEGQVEIACTKGACNILGGLGREEIDWLGGRDRFNVPGFEAEHAYSLYQFALEFRVAQFTRYDFAKRYFARGCDRQT